MDTYTGREYKINRFIQMACSILALLLVPFFKGVPGTWGGLLPFVVQYFSKKGDYVILANSTGSGIWMNVLLIVLLLTLAAEVFFLWIETPQLLKGMAVCEAIGLAAWGLHLMQAGLFRMVCGAGYGLCLFKCIEDILFYYILMPRLQREAESKMVSRMNGIRSASAAGGNSGRFTDMDPTSSDHGSSSLKNDSTSRKNDSAGSKNEGGSADSRKPETRKEEITLFRKRHQLELHGESGQYEGMDFPLEQGEKLRIGRDPAWANIILQNPSVSGKHCEIVMDEEGKVKVFDYSSNGLFFQDRKTGKGIRVGKGKSASCQDEDILYLASPEEAFSVHIRSEFYEERKVVEVPVEREQSGVSSDAKDSNADIGISDTDMKASNADSGDTNAGMGVSPAGFEEPYVSTGDVIDFPDDTDSAIDGTFLGIAGACLAGLILFGLFTGRFMSLYEFVDALCRPAQNADYQVTAQGEPWIFTKENIRTIRLENLSGDGRSSIGGDLTVTIADQRVEGNLELSVRCEKTEGVWEVVQAVLKEDQTQKVTQTPQTPEPEMTVPSEVGQDVPSSGEGVSVDTSESVSQKEEASEAVIGEPSTEEFAGQYVDAVMLSEQEWRSACEAYTTGEEDRTYCWLQDFNMDGIPEFIVGGNTVGNHAASGYHVYCYEDGEMKLMDIIEYDRAVEDHLLCFWNRGSGTIFKNDESYPPYYQGYLYWDPDQGYRYFTASIDGDAMGEYYIIDEVEIMDGTLKSTTRISITHSAEGWTAEIYMPGEDMLSVTSADAIQKKIGDLFQGLVRRKTDTWTFMIGSGVETFEKMYWSMDEQERRQALLEAFSNCYSLAEQPHENQEPPFNHLFDSDNGNSSGEHGNAGNSEGAGNFEEAEGLTSYLLSHNFFVPGNQDNCWGEYFFHEDGTLAEFVYAADGSNRSDLIDVGTFRVKGNQVILNDDWVTLEWYPDDGILLDRGDNWENRFVLIEGLEDKMSEELLIRATQTFYGEDYKPTGKRWADSN